MQIIIFNGRNLKKTCGIELILIDFYNIHNAHTHTYIDQIRHVNDAKKTHIVTYKDGQTHALN